MIFDKKNLQNEFGWQSTNTKEQEHANILKVTLSQKGMVSKKGTKPRNKGLWKIRE